MFGGDPRVPMGNWFDFVFEEDEGKEDGKKEGAQHAQGVVALTGMGTMTKSPYEGEECHKDEAQWTRGRRALPGRSMSGRALTGGGGSSSNGGGSTSSGIRRKGKVAKSSS